MDGKTRSRHVAAGRCYVQRSVSSVRACIIFGLAYSQFLCNYISPSSKLACLLILIIFLPSKTLKLSLSLYNLSFSNVWMRLLPCLRDQLFLYHEIF
jgi:hypothetical protein